MTLPPTLNWDSVEDAATLLDWLKQNQLDPNLNTEHTALPALRYQIAPDDLYVRSIVGALSAYQNNADDPRAAALIRQLLSQPNLNASVNQLLMDEIARHETLQRERSHSRIQALAKNAERAAASPDLAFPSSDSSSASALLPYMHLEHLSQSAAFVDSDDTEETHDTWVATFAVEIASVRALRERPAIEEACADLLIGLHHASEIAQNRLGLGLRVRFAWRYIARDQRIHAALLSRIEAPTEAEARAAFIGVWQSLSGLLPLRHRVFSYEPVRDPAFLSWLRQPSEIASACEITRQETTFTYEGRNLYVVFPVSMSGDRLSRILQEMQRLPGTNIVDIQFEAARLLPEEREAITTMLRLKPDAYANPGGDMLNTMLKRITDRRYVQALEIYNDLLHHLQNMAFLVRVTVASSEVFDPSALPLVVALGMFGASRYEILPAVLEDDLAATRQSLFDLTSFMKPQSRIHIPDGLKRLRRLWMPYETLSATRLSAPGPDGWPGLAVLKTRATTLPNVLPQNGILIGEALNQDQKTLIHVGTEDRARHIYMVGRTGTGKTTLLENMALQDIRAGHGVGVIDPHGDLIEAILERIPPERAQDVVLFDPSDSERPVGLNILDVETDFEKNTVVAEFIGLLYSIYDPGHIGIIGPRFEQAVRNAMLTAMAVESSTLIDVMRILSNRDYARKCLQFVTDPMVQAYWKDIVDGQSDFHRSEVLDYITSKFSRFVGDLMIRNIVGQGKTTLDFDQIVREGKILLVNLSKGKIGPENSQFLGLLLVPRLLLAAFQRAHLPADQRQPYYLYVDEFHNFTTPIFSTMLSEGRKYGLSLTVANQFISQLVDVTREAVFGNVGTLGAFQVGVKDSLLLAQEFYPVFDLDDLVNFPSFHIALKMPVNGAAIRPFLLKTLPSSPHRNRDVAAAIREYSRQHYGRDAVVVASEIRRRFDTPLKAQLSAKKRKNLWPD